MSWTAFENALHDWVADATGLPGDRVRFSHVEQPRSADGPFASINVMGPIAIGVDQSRHEFDELGEEGEEIILEATGTRELVVEVSFFGGDAGGDSGARALASKAMTGLSLSSIRFNVRAAGLFPFDVGPIRWLPAIVAARFEPRAILPARFYFNDVLEERTGYIDSAEITDETHGDIFVVP